MASWLKITCLFLALSFVQLPANAVPMYFDYTLSGGEFISGTLNGDVQQDGDTVAVSQILTFEYLSINVDTSAYYVGLFSTLVTDFPDDNGPGFVSFSGDYMDFASCDFELCGYGLLIANNSPSNDNIAFGFENPFTFASNLGFNPDAWNLSTIPTTVAEPSSLLLLLMGCVAFWGSRRYAYRR